MPRVKLALGLVMLFAVVSCATSEPIKDVVDVPVVSYAGRTVSSAEVATAIQRAGRFLGWQLTVEGPGLLTGRLARRSHLAIVEIKHDAVSYSIRYRDSVNLDAHGGQIHKGYNEWVESLANAIRAELQML